MSHLQKGSIQPKRQALVVGRQHPPPIKLQSTQVREHYISPFKFHSVNEQWQRDACVLLRLNFEGSNAMEKGGACTPLSSPQNIKPIQGDGNCMFRALSYVITEYPMATLVLSSMCLRLA